MNFSRKVCLAALIFALALFTGARHAIAQTQISGDIAGTVTDPTGAAIPGAKVTVTNAGTGVTQSVKTGAAGDYRVGLLQPGQYTLQVAAPGFRTTQRTVAVTVGQTATVNISVAVAQGVQTVQVEGTAVPLLQTENSDLSTTLTQQQVQNMPNPGGDITYYVNLTQGVVMNTQMGYGNSSAFGLPATSNNFTVNGAEDNDPFLNLNNSGPSNLLLGQNDISEVNIVANAYSAQYGALGGVQENIITRSGTNQFHGNATYFWTNSDLNANDWFNDNTGAPQPFSNANQWGAAIGGPIKHNRAWFFVNYEGMRFVTSPEDAVFLPSAQYESDPTGNTGNAATVAGNAATVYTDPSVLGNDGNCDNNSSFLYLNGNGNECAFYQYMFKLYAGTPRSATASPYGTVASGQPCVATGTINTNLPNDGLPAGCEDLNPGTAASDNTMFVQFPAGETYSNYLVANPKNDLTEVLTTARMDIKLGANDTGFIHFKRDHGLQPTSVDPVNPVFNAQSDQPDYEGQLEETHTFSPNLVNQFILSGSWYSAYFLSVNQAQATATFPYELELIDGSFSNLGGSDLAWPEGRNVTQYQVNDDVSWIHGKHTTSFGVLFKRDDVTDADLGIFTTPLGAEYGPGAAGPFSADDLYGAGLMLEGIQSFPQRLSEPIATLNLGAYVQDQWKLQPNLEITGGIRFEHNGNPTCGTSCLAILPDSYYNVTAGVDTPYNQALDYGRSSTFNQLQSIAVLPRFGFTYSLPNHQHTLFRGGFGMFSDVFPATIADDLLDNAPLNPQFNALFFPDDPSVSGNFMSTLAGTDAAFTTGPDSFANGGSYSSLSGEDGNFTPPNVFNVDKKLHYPTYEEWSLQWEQQIGNHDSISLGYVGNHGYHEPVLNNGVNASEAGASEAFGGLPANAALPDFGEITEVESAAVSNYNGLILSAKHQSGIATATLNYTWSHTLDEDSNGGILPFGFNSVGTADLQAPIDPFNLALNYGNADYDIRNNLNGSYVVTVPYFGGPKLLTDRWQVGGTLFWHTGFPFSITDSNATNAINYSGTYGGTVLADITNPGVSRHCGKSGVAGVSGGAPCFSASDFADPTSFTDPGQQRRNQFFGPGYFNTDFNVMKGFKIPAIETGQVQIGIQAYNVLNHANFANPDYNLDSATFGQIFSTVGVPTSVFGSFLGGDASPRILQLKANIQF